jgi:gamma-glutamylcyclotransferase (GGCT)/AIG2-like uncharacterized protein YtfP
MNRARMDERLIKYTNYLPCTLFGYRLVFNKKAATGNFTFANVKLSNPSDFVEGVLYTIPDEEIFKLDIFEGYPEHHLRRIVEVTNSERIIIPATIYIACEIKTVNEGEFYPTRSYLNHLLAARDFLTFEYYKKLQDTITVD